MPGQTVQIDLTLFHFLTAGFVFLVSFAGIFVAIGKLLTKQKTQCKDIKILNNAMWKDGRPLLQSVKEGKESYDKIMSKLNEMDEKQDDVNNERTKQISEIRLHMQKIDIWYTETREVKHQKD